jgi:hypothetical protein
VGSSAVTIVDTSIPWRSSLRVCRSIGFRFHIGPAAWAVNRFVRLHAQDSAYDVCWVDKGVLLTPATLAYLRARSARLLHYTPDTAFYGNHSRFSERTLPLYDLLVTTKSFEMDYYRQCVPADRLLLVTQGYDASVHYPRRPFADKHDAVVFVGLCEPHRERVVAGLLDAGVSVRLGGERWQRFRRRYRGHAGLTFLGEGVWGDAYAEALSSCRFGLGLLSKRFPELHTTRTFEIPACGTALLTEDNPEIRTFYTADEALFYGTGDDLLQVVQTYRNDPKRLMLVSDGGRRRVLNGASSYDAIVKEILAHVQMPVHA